jgi:hypothetical protein
VTSCPPGWWRSGGTPPSPRLLRAPGDEVDDPAQRGSPVERRGHPLHDLHLPQVHRGICRGRWPRPGPRRGGARRPGAGCSAPASPAPGCWRPPARGRWSGPGAPGLVQEHDDVPGVMSIFSSISSRSSTSTRRGSSCTRRPVRVSPTMIPSSSTARGARTDPHHEGHAEREGEQAWEHDGQKPDHGREVQGMLGGERRTAALAPDGIEPPAGGAQPRGIIPAAYRLPRLPMGSGRVGGGAG